MTQTASSPYVGPRFFERSEADQGRFFGRDRETQEIVSLIYGHPLLLVYAQSGAGKTSLFNAKIAPTLEARGFQVLPLARVFGALPEGVDPRSLDNPYLTNVLLRLAPDADLDSLAGQSLADFLRDLPRGVFSLPRAFDGGEAKSPPLSPPRQDHGGEGLMRPRPRVLVLDQFEEIFTHYPFEQRARQEAFFKHVTDALDDDPLLRCVFVIREDYLAQLDPFVELLPEELRVRFRLERLREPAARAAVEGPLAGTGRSFAEGAAQKLVKDLLQTRVEVGAGEIADVEGEFVEPVQLQVVCQSLWQDLPPGVAQITVAHLAAYANVGEALARFYERALQTTQEQGGVTEGELRAWFERALITPAGTRGTVYRGIEQTGGLPNAAVDALQDLHLIRGEQRSGSRWYELTHDRFVEPILASNRQWLTERQVGDQARQWLAERGNVEETRRRLEARADQWLKANGSEALLLKRGDLLDAERWMAVMDAGELAYNDGVRALVQASRDKQQRRRGRRRWAAVAVLAMLAVAILGTVLGFSAASSQAEIAEAEKQNAVQAAETAEAERQIAVTLAVQAQELREEAEARLQESRSREWAAAAIQGLDTDPERGVLLALEALRSANTWEAENALRRSLQAQRVRATLFGHQDRVNDAAYSPDGSALVTVSDDGTARVWDARSGQERALLDGDGAFLSTARFNPDGSKVFATGYFQDVWVWDTESWSKLDGFEATEASVSVAALSPDGTLLAAGDLDGTITVWDVAYAQQIATWAGHQGAIMGIDLASDGTRLVTAGRDGQAIVWSLRTGERLAVLDAQGGELLDVSFSLDGARVATAGADGTARLWDAASGRLLRVFSGHSAGVLDVAFSPDGRLLATAGADRTAKVWEIAAGAELLTLSGHTDRVNAVRFSPEGGALVTASSDGTARVWDLGPSHEWLTIAAPEGRFNGVAYSPDGRLLATANVDGTAGLWDAESGAEQSILRGHEGVLLSVAFSPDGSRLATASWDDTARIWNARTSEELVSLYHKEGVWRALFDPTGSRLVTAGQDGTAIVWDAASGQALSEFAPHKVVLYAAFSPNGTRLATSGEVPTDKEWNAQTLDPPAKVWALDGGGAAPKAALLNLVGHTETVNAVTYSPDGARLATASNDGTARLWDAETGEQVQLLDGHSGLVLDVAFSPDGRYAATASSDTTAMLWDLSYTGAYGLDRSTLTGHTNAVTGAAFSPDGRRLVTAGLDGTLRVYLTQIQDLVDLACARVTRNLSEGEWWATIGLDVDYRETCPDLPVPPGLPLD